MCTSHNRGSEMGAMTSAAAAPGSPGVERAGVQSEDVSGTADEACCPPDQTADSCPGSIQVI